MGHINETVINWNTSGLANFATSYTVYPLNGLIYAVKSAVVTGSGIANNGSICVFESGTGRKIIDVATLTGTTLLYWYPRLAEHNVSGTAQSTLTEPLVTLPLAASGTAVAASGTATNVGGQLTIYWYKP